MSEDSDSIERYIRLIRKPLSDENIIEPPKVLLDEAERLGQDPRRPPSAIARWVSGLWAEANHARVNWAGLSVSLAASSADRELMSRPSYFPSDFGLDLIPYPDDIKPNGTDTGYVKDFIQTVCYTSLSVPKPFDPHIHGDVTATTPGFGYNYQGVSPFPDQYDLTTKRGGGPRGGFAWTTGPTEGNHPSAILPQPTFNLGVVGYSNGGSNPEGVTYTNRPKTMSLGGLRNGWPHKVYFVRSRQVMFRNVYGPMSVTDATPRAPTVVLNGSTTVHGIVSIRSTRKRNSPQEVVIGINNQGGKRGGLFRVSDAIQIFLAPKDTANPPLVFTGYVAQIDEQTRQINVTCRDSLGLLSNETIVTEPTMSRGDVAGLIKYLFAGSAYAPPIGRMISRTRVQIPDNMVFKKKTKLAAIQELVTMCNTTTNPINVYCDRFGVIHMVRETNVDDVVAPYIAGRHPRTNQPQDFYPTLIEMNKGDFMNFNVATVSNTDGSITVTYPTPGSATYPTRPVETYVTERNVVNEQAARVIAQQILTNQGPKGMRWTVEGLPNRLDMKPGDVLEFASAQLSGRYRVFDVSWEMVPGNAPRMTLTLGRSLPALLSTIRHASGLGVG